MRYLGSPMLGQNILERRTIDPSPGKYSNFTIFRGTATTPTVVTNSSQLDNTILGILAVQPAGVEIIAGDRIDLTCGTIRIDITAYEAARLYEIEQNGTSTMADLSALLNDPQRNDSITGSGCVLQLVQVVR